MIQQRNLYSILPGIISNVTQLIADEKRIDLIEATRQFYASETYKKLEKANTEYWELGPVQLFEEFMDEASNHLF